jgi:hypothetical protein
MRRVTDDNPDMNCVLTICSALSGSTARAIVVVCGGQMKRYSLIASAVATFAIGCAIFAWNASADEKGPKPQGWEYQVFQLADVMNDVSQKQSRSQVEALNDVMTKRLNDLGNQGWELVTASDGIFVLKRAGGA